ncbi:putative quinol monooxygenase [Alienimonas sp. DA493]|uniref:putative quinol monooxygenase n=1 Tax=Alienimonas sp. DA493 TaxID=3373605 RepID=UPI003755097B
MPDVPPAPTEDQVILHFEVRIKPDKREEFRGHIEKMTASSKTEPGCLFYRYHVADDAPDHYVVWEVWEDRGAFVTHVKQLAKLFGPPAPGANPPLPEKLADCFAELRVHELTAV